jgi:twitching motility protein PilI
MANRQALRELQTRLAARLQQARSEGVAAGWLAVELGGQRFLLPLAQSGEIFPITTVQKVPYTRAWFMGVANLRGGLFGVVDLASFILGVSSKHAFDGSSREQARLVALNTAMEINCAVLVDRLGGLRGISDFVSREPASQEAPAYISAQYIDKVGQSWTELDLQQLASSAQFLGIAADAWVA